MIVLVTGGAGFIGSNFVRHMVCHYPDYQVINLDKLTYAGNLENLKEVESCGNYSFVCGDICNAELVDWLIQDRGIRAIVNFAAESHVDRSIQGAAAFEATNVRGTLTLLELARKHDLEKFLQVSTDEVYGSLGPEGAFTEKTPLQPNNPYAASKASADLLINAYHHTFDLFTLITRCSNNYGPYQFPEKLIPLMISNAMEGLPLPVYGDGQNVRDWIHVADHCRAIDTVLHHGASGETYNVGSGNEWKNIDLVRQILDMVAASQDLIRFVKDRPGHDRRYAIDATKIQNELQWSVEVDFVTGLAETVQWYREHRDWWQRIKDGEYQQYYDRVYRQERGIQ